MKRRYRALLSVALLAGAAAGLMALAQVGSRAEGPLSGGLSRIGSALGSVEHAVRARLRGPGRAADLRWFEPLAGDTGRLRQPGVILLGAYDSGIPQTMDGILDLEQLVGTSFPLIHIYTAWGDKPDQQFPRRIVSAIRELGSVPVITWEPWLADFSSGLHPHIALRAERDRHGLASVASGDYDFYVDAWAAAAARSGAPLFLRLGHEMNDPYRYPWGPQNNTKEEFIAAWRHVVDRFRIAGATNVIWVWSPHVAYEYWELYYPGEEWVDWVATGVLNFGPIAQWSRWWTFAEIFGQKYPALSGFGKPVMVAEFGSLSVGGNRARWYRDALTDLPVKYPAVRSVLFFNVRDDQTVTYQKVDWTISSDSAVVRAVRSAISAWPVRPTANPH